MGRSLHQSDPSRGPRQPPHAAPRQHAPQGDADPPRPLVAVDGLRAEDARNERPPGLRRPEPRADTDWHGYRHRKRNRYPRPADSTALAGDVPAVRGSARARSPVSYTHLTLP